MAYDAPLFVHTRFRELAAVRVDFDYIITHAETGLVLCRGITRHCATNRQGRPVAVDPVTVGIFHNFPK
jgi:acyl-CoA thioester hydrolase